MTVEYFQLPDALPDAPLDVTWQGTSAHIGPVDTVTPFIERLAGKTTCGTLTLMAGVLYWGAWRLFDHANQDLNSDVYKASFAFQVDWRYYDDDRVTLSKEPDGPVGLAASVALHRFMRQAMEREGLWYSFFQPVTELSYMAHLVHHVLPQDHKDRFHRWLFAMSDRLDRIAPKPDEPYRPIDEFPDRDAYRAFCAPHRGLPLPWYVLDLEREITEDAATLAAHARADVKHLDPAVIPFLRTTEEMRALGFQGQPYDGPGTR